MFRKRVVFTVNSLYADIPDYAGKEPQQNRELERLLDEYMTGKTVVIPKKDRHFFQDMTFSRIFSADNAQRLSRKLYHKYVLRREEEYNWIFQYARMHLVKAVRRKLLTAYYTDPVAQDRYVYYPFHVPLDVQLTARCPEFFDQESLVSTIAGNLPEGCLLYIKEHPAAIGGHDLGRLKRALQDNQNIKLIHPRHNSYDIIRNASCIITVNSKVGVEAIMQSKPVVVLGKTFYRGKGVTVDLQQMDGITDAVATAIGSDMPEPEKRLYFLNRAFQWTYPGELYENSSENVDNFYHSLSSFLTDSALFPGDRQLSGSVSS
jgi:capsule polysaccharide modification protein KpsS